MKNKKNVLFIIGTMKSGGAERAITNICNSLCNLYNITLVACNPENADYMPNVNVIEIKELYSRRKYLIGIYKLREIKKALNIDVSISFLKKSNLNNYLSRNKEKVVLCNRNHISSLTSSYSKIDYIIHKFIIKKSDLVVNVSKSVEKDQIDNFGLNLSKSVVIPNFCEIKQINKNKKQKIPQRYLKIFKKDVIIFVGRYSYQKGIKHLIKSFYHVLEDCPNTNLLLLGRGKEKEELNDLVKKLKISKSVYILDFDSNPYKYMYKSDIFVLPSLYEGFPNVILEAMTCGLPIIATNSPGGTAEILSNNDHNNIDKYEQVEYGILTPNNKENNDAFLLTNSELEMAKAIKELLLNKKMKKYYQLKSKQRIKKYKKESIINLWKKIIDN